MTERMLTAREGADRLGVKPRTILRWIRRGELDGVVVYLPGGMLRLRESRFEAWLEKRATPRRGVLATTQDAAQARRLSFAALATTDDEE